uniref:Thioredoxin domain-containing protein n=1 Tax=Suricata suricatta TaxID=37032 RepID=A0A673U358_SURSU
MGEQAAGREKEEGRKEPIKVSATNPGGVVSSSNCEQFERLRQKLIKEAVVREGLKYSSEGCVFICCQVGEKLYCKDPNNDFRKSLKVTTVPILPKYGMPQKLVESECLQANF